MKPEDNPFPVDSEWYTKSAQVIWEAKRREEEKRKATKLNPDIMRQPMTV